MGLLEALLIFLGVALGWLIAWLGFRSSSADLRSNFSLTQQQLTNARGEITDRTETNAALSAQIAGLEATIANERKVNEEKLALVNHAREEFRQVFQALSAEALKSNNQAFLQLARTSLEKFQVQAEDDLEQRQKAVETLVAPIAESLKNVDTQIQKIEEARNQAYGNLTAQVQSLINTQERLQAETGNLVKALRTPNVRGRWGEIQLKRVVEIAGMLPYCDFVSQETVTTDTGRLRPDLIIKLPGSKNIVVDAKTPLLGYLDAVESSDDQIRRQKLTEHAAQVRAHMNQLSSKAYWSQFDASPEFVVMFLPGETFFSAALEQDSALIEHGVAQRVIPSSPTTLIALLKAVAYGWNQEKLARSAREISDLGKELHDRLRHLGAHFEAVGKGLDRAVEAYNKAVGSLETRVMVSARKFAELGASVSGDIGELSPIETTTRNLTLEFDDPENIPPIVVAGDRNSAAGSESKRSEIAAGSND